MTRYGERREAQAAARPLHGGFTHSGSWFESETPTRGELLDFVRRAIRDRNAGRSPCDVILSLAAESPEVRAVFVPVASQWSVLTKHDDWGCAHTACSAHEAIKRGGKGG